ncbi:hypothetical protein [Herbinix luporum]|uniref:Uncharacterized protein n=1 Tax=Herbinix luporum TaxID=1679721 RepID=A0A0K8J5X4_9FIRM|nr:hypothetical protein [Herbinix luporum]CUH92728.1 hypothetical protein SD1D_1182 [Herbinix luporum]HHT56107.1 hypothetical protein [Herbinix luporum]
MEKRKLVINAAICDCRSVTEEILNSYESIQINTSCILVSKNSKELLSRYHVAMNTADVTEIPDDAEVLIQNGSFTIEENTIMSKPTVLIVNGSLHINKGSEKALESFLSIQVNGSVSYPSDTQNQLPPLKVNGSVSTYPSDAICLKNKFILDKVFILRAKNAKYYAKNKVLVIDETLDLSSLISKGTTFITNTAIIAENLLDKAILLFDDETDIKVLPAGYSYVEEGTLNDLMVSKHGDKIYVDGDLVITSESENTLKKITGLKVTGSILISKKLIDNLHSLDIEYKDLKFIKGKIIKDKGFLTINKNTLEGLEDGVTITDCGFVKINSDITAEEIEEKLHFIDCGFIQCQPDQKGAIELVSEDVGLIKDKTETSIESLDEDEDSLNPYDKNTQVINAATYKM